MDACMHGWMDAWMDGWMDEWMDCYRPLGIVLEAIFSPPPSANPEEHYVGH